MVWITEETRGLIGGRGFLDFKELLGYGHLEFIHLAQVGETAILFTVEDFLPVKVDFQAASAVGR